MKHLLLLLLSTVILWTGCAGAAIFPDIGTNMSNPITAAVDSTNARLYVINSDYKVLYGGGSIHVVDISDPASPTMVDYVVMPPFSGQAYMDEAGLVLYTPNRAKTGTSSSLFRFDMNEDSEGFLKRTVFETGSSPYGIACCDASNRLFVISQGGALDYYLIDDGMRHHSLSLMSRLSTGITLSGEGALRGTIYGGQIVITREFEGLWVITLDKLGVSGKQPIDYFIYDISSPRGIATDGTYIYVAAVNGSKPVLYVLDTSPLTPRIGNTDTELVSKEDDNILKAVVDFENGSNPEGVVVVGDKAYVTDFDNGRVFVVDLSTYAVATSVKVGTQPYEMAVYSPAGAPTHLFVANSGSNTVSVIDLSTDKVIATYP